MKSRHYLILLVIVTVAIVVSVYLQQTLTYTQNQDERIFEVKLTISAPLSTATLLIEDRGLLKGVARISYEASSPRTGIEKQTDSSNISLQEFFELTNLIKDNDFWSFNETYYDENLMDGTTYTVTVNSVPHISQELSDARTYSVSCYGSCPEQIFQIVNKIKELWGKEILQVGM
jgi:hypothetical protein